MRMSGMHSVYRFAGPPVIRLQHLQLLPARWPQPIRITMPATAWPHDESGAQPAHAPDHGVTIRLEVAWSHPQPGWLEDCGTEKKPSGHYCALLGGSFWTINRLKHLIAKLLLESTDRHRTKPVLVCWGHAIHTPTLIDSREAIFKFLRYKLRTF